MRLVRIPASNAVRAQYSLDSWGFSGHHYQDAELINSSNVIKRVITESKTLSCYSSYGFSQLTIRSITENSFLLYQSGLREIRAYFAVPLKHSSAIKHFFEDLGNRDKAAEIREIIRLSWLVGWWIKGSTIRDYFLNRFNQPRRYNRGSRRTRLFRKRVWPTNDRSKRNELHYSLRDNKFKELILTNGISTDMS